MNDKEKVWCGACQEYHERDRADQERIDRGTRLAEFLVTQITAFYDKEKIPQVDCVEALIGSSRLLASQLAILARQNEELALQCLKSVLMDLENAGFDLEPYFLRSDPSQKSN